jgi:hypothetical protein
MLMSDIADSKIDVNAPQMVLLVERLCSAF